MSYSGLHTNIDSVLCLTYHHMAHIVHTVPFLMILALLLVVVVVAVNASEHQSTGSGSPMDETLEELHRFAEKIHTATGEEQMKFVKETVNYVGFKESLEREDLKTDKGAISAVQRIHKELHRSVADFLPTESRLFYNNLAFSLRSLSADPEMPVNTVLEYMGRYQLAYYRGTSKWCVAMYKTSKFIRPALKVYRTTANSDSMIFNRKMFSEMCNRAIELDGLRVDSTSMGEHDAGILKLKHEDLLFHRIDVKREI